MIMANVNPGETFGEALCHLGQETGIYIRSVTDATVLWMNTDKIKSDLSEKTKADVILVNRFITMLARRALMMNDRIQILSKLTIREKLITFFSQYNKRLGAEVFELPFNRNDMAIYLGVNRSALSRELSKMKSDGIVSFHKNKFRITN